MALADAWEHADDAARAVDRLRETLAGHYGDAQGVAFDSLPG
jgi:hypothetical protein